MLVDIVIVTYFSSKEIRACLESLMMQTIFSQCHVWIVDNASQDDTLRIVETLLSSNITLLPLKENIGFGCAVNKAAMHAKSEFIYLLNPDALLKTPHDLERLVAYANAHPCVGVVGSRVLEPSGKETKPRRHYPQEKKMRTALGSLPGEFAWVIGASFLLKTAVFHLVNGFDTDFFLYGEEVDLCLRIRKQGLEIAFDGDVTVEHIGSASANQLPSYQKKTLKTKGLYLFLTKHYPFDEVKNLVKKEARRSFWRYYLNRWIFPQKACVYRAELDVAREFLRQPTVP